MKRPSMTILLILFVYGFQYHLAAEPVLTPYIFFESFENGSVGAWSSYPPAQDTAYDPTIWVKPLYHEDAENRSLFREITPNYEIDYEYGVRKKLDMYIDTSSVLSFKCYIKSNRSIGGVKIKFGFEDGFKAERTIPFNTRLTWRECTIALSDIIQGDMPKKLTAVAFIALCPNADTENLLRFGIDDVRINGMQEARWEFSSPAAHKLDEWSDFIADTHFKEGDKITISGVPPFKAGSIAVIISRALTGENEMIFRMRRSGAEWSANIPLTNRSGITAGMWRATIKASSEDKKDDFISTSLVFLVKTKDAPAGNPRLLMRSGDAEKILAKASNGRMKEIYERLRRTAANYTEKYDYNDFNYNLDAYDDIFWLPTYGGYVGAIRTPANYIRSNGVVYGVSGDAGACDAACSALLKMSEWPSYVHPHILNQGQFTYWPVGQILADLAVGYDFVADSFSPDERKKVAEALYSKGITEIFKEYVQGNRVSSNTSNWIGDVTAGGILLCLAVMNDFPAEKLEPYFTGMILKMNAFIEDGFGADGAYGEGYSYLNHALHCINVAVPALDRTFGIHFPEKLGRCHESLFYHADFETRNFYDFGDTRSNLGSLSNFTSLIAKYRDPYLKWLYDRSPGSSDVDLFLMDESVAAKGPDGLPTARLFKDVGTAVFRSGFGNEDFHFIFRCGPFYNHQHFDQGSFYLIDRGEKFLGEMGKSGYYNDPWYQKLVIQPGGHNCILVNGNPESQRAGDLLRDVSAWKDYASITDFTTFDGGAFVSGRLERIYKDTLEYLRRSALYIEPRTVVLIDEILGTTSVNTVELRFHAPMKEDITVSGNDAHITRPAGTLTIRTLTEGSTPKIMKRPLTITEFGSENAITMKSRGFLQLTAELNGNTRETTFVNVLSTDSTLMANLNEKNYSDHAVISINGAEYYINTSNGATAGKAFTEGMITTDALVYSLRPEGYIAIRATNLEVEGEKLFSSEKPISLVIRDSTIMTIGYSASEQTELWLKFTSKPKRVTLDGNKYRDWKYSRKSGLRLELPAGSGMIGIM